MPKKCESDEERLELFMAKVLIIPFVECWLWIGGVNGRPRRQYGAFHDGSGGGSHLVRAHRWLYEKTVGPIPEGLELDHLCRVALCVRPRHLEPVTPTVNVQRGFSPTAIIRRARLATGLCSAGHAVAEHWDYDRPHCRKCASDYKNVPESESRRRRWTRGDLEAICAAGAIDRDLSASMGRTVNAIQTMRSLYSRRIRRTP